MDSGEEQLNDLNDSEIEDDDSLEIEDDDQGLLLDIVNLSPLWIFDQTVNVSRSTPTQAVYLEIKIERINKNDSNYTNVSWWTLYTF